jgi:hypothetical protein
MLLTDAQIREISQIINDHHSAFVASVVSPEAIDPETLARLKEKGMVDVQVSSIEDAYLFGQVTAALESADVVKMGYQDFKDWLKKNPIPLTEVERRAVEVAAHSAGQYCKGLGNRIDAQTGQVLIEADQALARQMREQIQDATALTIARRETARQLRSDLGHRTGDWARDLDRIAITELNNAHQQAVGDGLAKEYGPDVRVFKRPMPDACAACKALHLGADGQPMIWRLSALEANGSNVGKKRADWLPVVGSIHPHCACQMVRCPEGWGFNEEGQLVPGGELGERYETTESFAERRGEQEKLRKSALEGRVIYQGIPIAIENWPGSVRSWTDADGTTGNTRMWFAYGFVEGTEGTDGDEIDVFVGPDPDAEVVYLVHQQNPRTGLWDEDKALVGFPSEAQALQAYRMHYDRPDFEASVSQITVDHFKRWYEQTAPERAQEALSEPLQKRGGVRFVLPLEKALQTVSGSLEPSFGAMASRAGARSPGPGVGANYLFNTPPRQPPVTLERAGFELYPRELYEEAQKRGEGMKRDPSVYDFDQPLESVAKPWAIPEWFYGDRLPDPKDVEYNKQMAIDFGTRNLRRPRNTAEIDDDASDK